MTYFWFILSLLSGLIVIKMPEAGTIFCNHFSFLACPLPPVTASRVSFKTSFHSKQPKLFRHYLKQNVCFGCFASILKQRVSVFRLNRNKQKSNQKTIWYRAYFGIFLRKFWVVSVCFGWFQNSLFWLFHFCAKTATFDESKQTEDQPKQFNREHVFRKFGVASVLFWNSSVCFGCFNIGSKHRNKPKQTKIFLWNKPKHNQNRSCFGLFRFDQKFFFVRFEYTPAASLLLILILSATDEIIIKTPKWSVNTVHCKQRLAIFPSPCGLSLTKLSLTGNNLIISGQGEFG